MIRFGNIKRILLASLVALMLWTLISVNATAFKTDTGFEYFDYIFSYVMSLGIWALIALKFNFSDKLYKGISIGVFALVPFFIMQISMTFLANPEFGMGMYFMNVLFYFMILSAFFAITRSMRWSGIITAVICYVFNLATFVVNMLRGTPLIPSDFLAIGTAMQVAENYVFRWESPIVVSAVLLVFVIALILKFSFKPNIPYRHIIFTGSGVVMAAVMALIFSTMSYTDSAMDIFDQNHANNTHGTAVSFFLNAKAVKLEKPDTYDAKTVEDTLLAQTDYTVDGKKPNVLVIMNESYADLSVLGNLQTNEDYMPFFNSLKNNTVKGEVLVSPFGGYTCNSEFEFLTGMSMGLLPSGSAPYLQFVQMNYPYSLPNHFKRLGYETVALHPYMARCWNRDTVYGLMGFDNFISLDNMDKYQNKNEFEYIRGYMSDRTSYSAAINQFVNKKPNESMFLFNITMQNHGGYSGEYSNFTPDIEITNLDSTYKQAEQYLSLIRESDRALEELIYYFSDWDEPIIIMMFGDHQPAVEQGFFEELLGKPLDMLSGDELQARYRVPFMVWANFDIESETGIETSVNYLSNILMEKAGLPKSEVNMFLDRARGEIPQINAMGHYDANGVWTKNDTENSEILSEYKNLAYYMLKQKNKGIEK